jgi:hypothetical protein
VSSAKASVRANTASIAQQALQQTATFFVATQDLANRAAEFFFDP